MIFLVLYIYVQQVYWKYYFISHMFYIFALFVKLKKIYVIKFFNFHIYSNVFAYCFCLSEVLTENYTLFAKTLNWNAANEVTWYLGMKKFNESAFLHGCYDAIRHFSLLMCAYILRVLKGRLLWFKSTEITVVIDFDVCRVVNCLKF